MDDATLLAIYTNQSKAKPHQHHNPLHGEPKLVRRLSEEELAAYKANPTPGGNNGIRRHNTNTLAYKAAEHKLTERDAVWITLEAVLRLAKNVKSEAELRQVISDYYHIKRRRGDDWTILSHRELGYILKALSEGRSYYCLTRN